MERLASLRHWDAIPRWYASTEPKAVLTAQKLTRRPIVQVPGLRELERGTGLVSDYEDAIRRLFAFPDHPANSSWETANQAQQRIVAAIVTILEETTHEDVAIVSHGLVILICGFPTSMGRSGSIRATGDRSVSQTTPSWKEIG